MTAYVWGLSNKDGKAPAKKAEPATAAPATATAASEASAPAAEAASAASAPAATAATATVAPAADVAEVTYNANDGAVFFFATGKSDVAANAETVAADLVKAAKEGKRLVVSGYTDSTGNAAANAELSKKRAQAVQAFFEAQGVKAENIELRKPENTTAAQGNDAQGRRVEVKLEG